MRSKLFVPGSRPELFGKALASAADAVSFDLEDSVTPERKAEARAAVAGFLADRPQTAKTIIVRVNPPGGEHFAADVEALAGLSGVILNVPKVATAEGVAAARAAMPAGADGSRPFVLANIESAAGLSNAAEIAAAEGVMGLQIGFGDLFIELGAAHDAGLARHVRVVVRIAAAAAGIACFDSAFVDIADEAGFEAEAEAARALGFTGKSCIHPRQIAVANRVFRPTEAEIDQARAIVAAAEAHRGTGAFVLDGRMVDLPFIEQARHRLAAAESCGAGE